VLIFRRLTVLTVAVPLPVPATGPGAGATGDAVELGALASSIPNVIIVAAGNATMRFQGVMLMSFNQVKLLSVRKARVITIDQSRSTEGKQH
jgi:hypothetical protein